MTDPSIASPPDEAPRGDVLPASGPDAPAESPLLLLGADDTVTCTDELCLPAGVRP